MNRAGSSATEDASEWKIPPFWHKLNSFFLFPLQMEPLIYAVVLALCAYGLLLGFPIALAVILGLALSVSRYAFKVAALASRGIVHSSDYRANLMDDAWKWLPWKFFGVLLIYGMVVVWLMYRSLVLGLLANVLVSFLVPAMLMVLINTCSLRSALNPFELLATVFGVGKSYLLLCFFLFLLQQGAPMAAQMLLKLAPSGLMVPLLSFVVIYFSWVMAAMIGYVMYQHHAALDIDPLRAPDEEAAQQEDPALVLSRRRDAQVAQLVQDGKMTEALTEAREWQRAGDVTLADLRRYFRVLKLTDEDTGLAAHGQRFITMLLAQQRAGEALEVWTSCAKRQRGFLPETAPATLELAQQAWRAGKPKYVLLLCHGFDKRFPRDDLAPQILELVARAYKQGLNEPMQAMRVYLHMKQRFATHASTQEVQWMLRDELAALEPSHS